MLAHDAIHGLATPPPRPRALAPRASAGGRAALLAAHHDAAERGDRLEDDERAARIPLGIWMGPSPGTVPGHTQPGATHMPMSAPMGMGTQA